MICFLKQSSIKTFDFLKKLGKLYDLLIDFLNEKLALVKQQNNKMR